MMSVFLCRLRHSWVFSSIALCICLHNTLTPTSASDCYLLAFPYHFLFSSSKPSTSRHPWGPYSLLYERSVVPVTLHYNQLLTVYWNSNMAQNYLWSWHIVHVNLTTIITVAKLLYLYVGTKYVCMYLCFLQAFWFVPYHRRPGQGALLSQSEYVFLMGPPVLPLVMQFPQRPGCIWWTLILTQVLVTWSNSLEMRDSVVPSLGGLSTKFHGSGGFLPHHSEMF